MNFNLTKKYLNKTKPELIFHIASYADVRKSFFPQLKLLITIIK